MNDSPNLLSDTRIDLECAGLPYYGNGNGRIISFETLHAIREQAKLANEIPALKARIAELESLLTQAACDKIEATAFEAMKERLENIGHALVWAVANATLGYDNWMASGDSEGFDPHDPDSIIDALIALHERSGT